MDNYREKIVRIVERELKRTEEYQQRRDEYGNEEYILGCIMVKGDAFPKEVIAHAFVEDMGLELQFQIWRDEPRIRQKQAMWYDLTLFDVEGDFFGKLEQGYSILSVSDLFHCTAWNATEYLADEQNRDKENSCWKGMQRYLNYCKKHGITRNYLVKKEEYGDDNAWYSTAYSKANNITDPELLAVYQKFTAMVEKASNTTDDMDARYEAYADAEAYMLDKVITLPLYKVVSWEMTHVNDYSKIYAPYGIQINKFKNWETSVDLYTTEDYAKLAAIYEANAAK